MNKTGSFLFQCDLFYLVDKINDRDHYPAIRRNKQNLPRFLIPILIIVYQIESGIGNIEFIICLYESRKCALLNLQSNIMTIHYQSQKLRIPTFQISIFTPTISIMRTVQEFFFMNFRFENI